LKAKPIDWVKLKLEYQDKVDELEHSDKDNEKIRSTIGR
jgi:hypothetical protein